MTLTCWTTAFCTAQWLNGSLIRTSKTSSLASHACFAAQPHTPSSAPTEARRGLMFILCGPVLTKHGLVAAKVCRFEHLISGAALISFIIRCSGCFHTHTRHSVTCCLVHGEDTGPPAVLSRPCMDKRHGEHWGGLTSCRVTGRRFVCDLVNLLLLTNSRLV